MSKQLEVVKFRDTVVVTGLPRFIPNLSPLTLEVVGEDFRSVDEVLVNEVKAPEFLIISPTVMWVQLPEAAYSRIDSVEVISSLFTASERSRIDFKLGNKTRTVQGPQKLLQLFVKWLLQSPGSDIFNPERGGGLQELAGRVTSTQRLEPVLATITRAVTQTSNQMQRAQVNQPNLPLNERLLSADIASVEVSTQLMEAHVRINLRTLSGESARASIQL
jgi:hypothetical protein